MPPAAPPRDPAVQAAFKEVMAGVCTPVAVATTSTGGEPHGTTVSAFASLSMTPPMALVSLDRGSDLLPAVRTSGTFGLNVLARGQAVLAARFARKGGPAKFDGITWELSANVPRIPDAIGFTACVVDQLIEAGDHVLALGLVVAASGNAAEPLTYYRRAFGTHAPLELL